ncbi:MAG: Serine/threonine-protein kinase PknD [Chlamydiae bacterium]|nr:Serine/threonine-protein kinase PknD [Chlamydiota bacterium]
MAPERVFGEKATVLTDIYSLGVMLYQILALQFPFRRKSIKELRKLLPHEKILPPEEVAPDREISPHLSNIAKKCLSKDPKRRFQSVRDLIRELENYIEGTPEWQRAGQLSIANKNDWQFQENVALAKHVALTRGIEMIEWFNLMISKAQFPGNIKIETELTLKEGSNGVGVLFCVPENNIHKGLEESYCMWVKEDRVCLYRSNVEVLNHREFTFEKNRSYHIRITLIDNHIRFFVDGIQKFGFLNHIPLPGTRIGLLVQDTNFDLGDLKVFVGSQNIMVNCLAVPDAFLARHDYDESLAEYRKISHSFPGRAEGREAMFRAGMTLLKKAEQQTQKTKKEALFAQALDEFETLHNTPGAPLEYLGKSLVYKAQGDFEEEAKCLELALRKYPKHPLKPILIENILSRLHESSQHMRHVAYLFALMVLRHLPHLADAQALSDILDKHLEPLPFFAPSKNRNLHLIIQLAFWLNKPLVLFEMLEKNALDPIDAQNAHIGLILLGCEDLADLSVLEKNTPEIEYARFEHALSLGKTLPDNPFPLWKNLHTKEWESAKEIAESMSEKQCMSEGSPDFFLYGCYLALEKGEDKALEHLTGISEKAFTQATALLSHYLLGRINLEKGWIEKSFFWEKCKLLQQLALYALCTRDEKLQKLVKSHVKKV